MYFFHLSNVRSFDTSLFIRKENIIFHYKKTEIFSADSQVFQVFDTLFYDQIYDNCSNCSNISIHSIENFQRKTRKFCFCARKCGKKDIQLTRVYSTILVLLIIAQCVLLNTYLGPLLDKQLKMFALASLTVCECWEIVDCN